MFEKYFQAVQYLRSLHNLGDQPDYMKGNPRPEIFNLRLRHFLALIGDPHKNQRYIHITGTSGKGSVTAMTQSILASAGFRCGAFFSPFPTTTIELIKINDQYIAPDELADLLESMKPSIEKCYFKSPFGRPSYYEIVFALALLYFKKRQCDFICLEVMCGGKYDATNIIENPLITVITNIGLDHMKILGNTRKKIATDKAGIIKKGSMCITAEKRKSLRNIFQNVCNVQKANFTFIDGSVSNVQTFKDRTEFHFREKPYTVSLLGEHQAENAGIAIETAHHLGMKQKDIVRGLFETFIPIRMEIIESKPLTIIDGAHNSEKISAMIETLSTFSYQNLHLVFTLSEGKPLRDIIKQLSLLKPQVYLTRFETQHRNIESMKKMKNEFERNGITKIHTFFEPARALKTAKKNAERNDLILITGSMYLCGELRTHWISEHDILKKRASR